MLVNTVLKHDSQDATCQENEDIKFLKSKNVFKLEDSISMCCLSSQPGNVLRFYRDRNVVSDIVKCLFKSLLLKFLESGYQLSIRPLNLIISKTNNI